MNNSRRKEIARAQALLNEAKSILETASNDERAYFENMPESIQFSDKGEAAEAAANSLEDAATEIDEVLGAIEQALSP